MRPEWDNLTDSKKLSAKKRTELNQLILAHAAATGLGWVSASELDRYGLSNALKLACRRAVKQVLAAKIGFDEITVDGTVNFLADTPLSERVTILKKADFLVKEVSAASIIAKVARDNYMIKMSEKYPNYGFEKHVGYGTAAHKQALLQHGICPEHRRSFRPIRELLSAEDGPAATVRPPKQKVAILASNDATHRTTLSSTATPQLTSTERGQAGEQAVIDYLQAQDHQIVAHNYKTKSCEIDIISTHDGKIYFTEVKYRQSADHGTALAQITPQKLEQMRYAANLFLAQHPNFSALQPLLAGASVNGPNFQLQDWIVLS